MVPNFQPSCPKLHSTLSPISNLKSGHSSSDAFVEAGGVVSGTPTSFCVCVTCRAAPNLNTGAGSSTTDCTGSG